MPQNEIANSPSNPVLLNDGPFKGQMLWGDVTYGGLQRGFLEKVDGEFQGAVFRHSAGLEAGVNRTMIGPDGAIYVGGIGEGGNWGEDEQAPLRPPEAHPERRQRLRHGEDGGHRGRLQDHLHAADLATRPWRSSRTRYKFKQWRYVPTSQYGGPKVDEETLLVTDATVVRGQEDGHAARSTASSRAASCTSARRARSRRATGEELWNTEAWYTLNSLPGYEAPAERGLLRGRGGASCRQRREHRRPSTAATPARASSAASAPPARA